MASDIIYRSRNADVASIETEDTLDDLGSESPGQAPITVPTDYTHIRRVIVAVGCDGAALGNLVALVKLQGDGMVHDEAIVTDGFDVPVATGTGNILRAYVSPVLNFPINAGAGIKVIADSFGDGESDFEVGVTLELTKGKIPLDVPRTPEIRTRSYTVDVDSVDTKVSAIGDLGEDGSPSTKVPPGTTHLVRIIFNAGYDQSADGSSVALIRLHGDWVEGQPHTIMVLGRGSIAGQSGSDEGVQRSPPFELDTMLEVTPNGDIQLDVENAGDDPGNGTAGVTLLFA